MLFCCCTKLILWGGRGGAQEQARLAALWPKVLTKSYREQRQCKATATQDNAEIEQPVSSRSSSMSLVNT